MTSPMMLHPMEQYHLINNRLLSHKSSFQAWKCVSFGCSLLVIMLLLSKYYEVNSDLHLLMGIDRLLMAQESSNNTLTWPPVPIDMVLPPNSMNESNFGMESLENNGSMLMSHMHMSLSRELTGSQLLRQEVDAFVAEFKTARSTLSLSTLLVGIYIVSWILMTLAINDTRISNDISLRNILLLSVFGAIDVASSIGFVMVRVIMFSVKNSTFAMDVLGSNGLKDTPVKLSSDQLTAFTALRLIAMRSCAAYVDLYVSTVVALLTVLRLYAIIRALTYYRKLRRVTYRSGQSIMDHKLPIWSSSGLYPPPPGQATHLFAAHHHLISTPHTSQLPDPGRSEALMNNVSQHQQQQQNGEQHYRLSTASGSALPLDLPHTNNSTFRYQSTQGGQSASSNNNNNNNLLPPPTHSKLMFSSPQSKYQAPPPPPPPPEQPSTGGGGFEFKQNHSHHNQQAAAATVENSGNRHKTNRKLSSHLQLSPNKLPFSYTNNNAQTLLHRTTSNNKLSNILNRHSLHNVNPNSSAPDLLFMNGIRSSSYLGPLNGIHREEEEEQQCESDPPSRQQLTSGLKVSSSSTLKRRQRQPEEEDEDEEGAETEPPVSFDERVASGEIFVEASNLHQDLLTSSPPPPITLVDRHNVPIIKRHHYSSQNISGSGGNQSTAYTLVDANQLPEKLARRLVQVSSGTNKGTSGRYKQATRYKQILVPSVEPSTPSTLLKTAIQRRQLASSQSLSRSRSRAHNTGGQHHYRLHTSSSHIINSSPGATSASTSPELAETDIESRAIRSLSRRTKRKLVHSSGVPLSEEFVTSGSGQVFERVSGKNGQSYLLGKCLKLDKEQISTDDDDDDDSGCSTLLEKRLLLILAASGGSLIISNALSPLQQQQQQQQQH